MPRVDATCGAGLVRSVGSAAASVRTELRPATGCWPALLLSRIFGREYPVAMSVPLHMAVAMSALTLAAACSGSPSPVEPGPKAQRPVTLGAQVGALVGVPTPRDGALDAFWRKAAPAAGVEYRSPRAVIAYSSGEVPDIACRDAFTADQWRENAFYCAEDETIAFDADFVTRLGDEFGPFAGVAVLAHEWGHHVAGLSRPEQAASFTVQRELEADCLAGVFAGGLEAATGDVTSYDDFARTFFRLGNEDFARASWFQAGEHGSPSQRFVAWSLGYQSQIDGVALCGGYSQWQPTELIALGRWAIRPLPGTVATPVRGGLSFSAGDRLPPWRLTHVSVMSNGRADAALGDWLSGTFPGAELLVDVKRVKLDGLTEYAVVEAADGTHVVGLDARQLQNGTALVYDVLVEGSPGDVPVAAIKGAYETMAMAAAWVCAPGESSDPDSDDYELMCAKDL